MTPRRTTVQLLLALLLIACSVDDPTLRSMPTLLVPGSPPAFPATLTTPADGDPANAASVNVAFQALVDGGEAARIAAQGRRYRFWTLDGANLVVAPVGGFSVTSGGVWLAARHAVPTTVNAAAALGAALAATTRYYLYIRIVAGVPTFAVGVDGPDAGLLFRALSTDYLWLGTFITDSNSQVVPQITSGGRTRYPATKFMDGLTVLSSNVIGAGVPFVPGVAWPSFALSAEIQWVASAQSAGGTVQGAIFTIDTGFITAAGFSRKQLTPTASWGDWNAPVAGPVVNKGTIEVMLIPGGAPPEAYLGPSGVGVLSGSMLFVCSGYDY